MNESDLNQKNNDTKNIENLNLSSNQKSKKNDKDLKKSDSSTGDIISKINKEAKEINGEINSDNLKVFEKYHDLTIKELEILLSQKNDNLLSLNEQKEKYKKTLNEIFKKLNNTIGIQFKYINHEEEDPELILNLEKTIEEKKTELENSKKMNKIFKSKYEYIKRKISGYDNDNKKVNVIENKIDSLKKKNLLIKKEINDIRIDKLKHKKEYELISDNKKFSLKIKLKTEEMNNFSAQKQGYFNKLNLSMKSLDSLINEVKRFEEIYNASINEEIDENLVLKINFWIKLIKNDLSGEKSDIISRIENDKSLFLNKVTNANNNNKYEITAQNYVNHKYNLNINTTGSNNKINHEISDVNSIENTASLENSEKKNYNIENSEMNNNIGNSVMDSIESQKQNRLFINRIIINKNKSSSLIFSNFNKKLSNSLNKDKKIFQLKMKNINNSNGNYNSNLEYKTLFKKLNYLKLKSPFAGSMKLKLTNINNLENYNKASYNNYNNIISERIKNSKEKNINNTNINNFKSLPNINITRNNSDIYDIILTKDYNQITGEDYRELLCKKDQYLEQSLRLEKNIEEIQKIKNKKLSNVIKIIEENAVNLEKLKNMNHLLQKEIQNLSNVQKFRIEQALLQSELHSKKINIKKIKIIPEQKKEKETDKIIEEYNSKTNKEKKNKIDYFDEVFRKNKKVKNKSKEKNIINNDINQNREEKLKLIKEKYKEGGYDINEKEKGYDILNKEEDNIKEVFDKNKFNNNDIDINNNEGENMNIDENEENINKENENNSL